MRVVVDTSVWVDHFRGRTASVAANLAALLDDDRVAIAIPIRIELLGGTRAQEATRLGRLLDAVPTFRPTEATWATTEQWALRAARAGQRFGFGDLLIGAVAAEHGCPVWSLDADFGRMADLGFIAVHQVGP